MNPDKNNYKVRESPREDHERSRKIIESTSSSEMARSQYQSHEKQCPQANTHKKTQHTQTHTNTHKHTHTQSLLQGLQLKKVRKEFPVKGGCKSSPPHVAVQGEQPQPK